ncbi:MAG: recombinase family protein [Acidimicrobiales bacterium]
MAMAQMLSVFAELERRLIGERTKAALAVKKAQGMRLGRPRTVPHEVVQRITAEREAGLSWQAISDCLNKDGVPRCHGGRQLYPGQHALRGESPGGTGSGVMFSLSRSCSLGCAS